MSVERFQILSLDGGGIRGMFSAAVLAGFEKDHDVSVVDHFDMIVGTSTGGILAIGLGLGIAVSEMRDLYVNEGLRIFPPSLGRRVRHWCRPKYSPDYLGSTLRKVFGSRRLSESRRALLIPYYDLGRSQPSNFKTRHHPDFTRDHERMAWEVAMGTTAAPTYLPANRSAEGARHVDGGVWANNPALAGAIEAHRFLGVAFESMRILSIGTAHIVKEWPGGLDKGGKLKWSHAGVELLMRAQSDSTTEMARLLVGKDRLHRIDPTVTDTWSELDKVQTDKFLSRAYSESMVEGPRFRDLFLDHKAMDLRAVFALGAKHAGASV